MNEGTARPLPDAGAASAWPNVAAGLAHARAAIPLREGRLLLQHVLGISHAELAAHPERALAAEQSADFGALVARRASGEPIAYLIGEREFYGLDFTVTPAVLIPRPETELLVDRALEKLSRGGARVLDLGTGSGCVAVALAKRSPQARLTAVDLAEAALEVARNNARRHGVAIHFRRSDWFSALAGEVFDLILANPPYVADGDPHLGQGDLRFEPHRALSSGSDGLDALRHIIAGAPRHLAPGGGLFVEHGYDQADAVATLLAQAGFDAIEGHADLAGNPRVAGGRFLALRTPDP